VAGGPKTRSTTEPLGQLWRVNQRRVSPRRSFSEGRLYQLLAPLMRHREART